MCHLAGSGPGQVAHPLVLGVEYNPLEIRGSYLGIRRLGIRPRRPQRRIDRRSGHRAGAVITSRKRLLLISPAAAGFNRPLTPECGRPWALRFERRPCAISRRFDDRIRPVPLSLSGWPVSYMWTVVPLCGLEEWERRHAITSPIG